MKYVSKDTVHELVRRVIPHLAYELPQDISAGMCAMCKNETHSLGKAVLEQLCTNDEIARTDKVPVCQDTGTARVNIQLGKNVAIAGDVFDEVNAAVAEAYINGKLRLSVVKDSFVDRTNSGDNTPAFCGIETIDEPDVARLNVMIKGGGSDNASRVVMLVPGDGRQGIIDQVTKCIREKAASACPPLVIGLGIGGTFDSVAEMAQRALFRPVGVHSDNPEVAAFEQEVLDAVNATGVGAGGLGGSATCQQVNIETDASHIASMPIAIDLGCGATRRCTINLPLSDFDEATGQMSTVSIDDIERAIDEALIRPNSCNKLAEDFVGDHVKRDAAKADNGGQATDPIRLQLPLDRSQVENLKVGDKVLLSGPIYTLRDAGHIRLLDEMEEGKPLPYGLEGQTIYYAGPSPAKAGRPFGAIGPTTASRMDFAAPTLYEHGVVASIGKGRRSAEVHESCKKTKSIFFATIGGCAAYLAKCIKSAEMVAYEDLGPEALRKCIVEDFPVFVGIDTEGRDIYDH